MKRFGLFFFIYYFNEGNIMPEQKSYTRLIYIVDRKVYEMTKTIIDNLQTELFQIREKYDKNIHNLIKFFLRLKIYWIQLQLQKYTAEYENTVVTETLNDSD